MWPVLIPFLLLFAITLLPLPRIGGDVRLALLAAGVSAALLQGLPLTDWPMAIIDGIDRLSWVIWLSLFGSLYAETQLRIGAMRTTLDLLGALFGRSPAGLVCAVIITLVLGGSLLGDAIAASAVVGFLVVRSLAELGISGERIAAIILLGALVGSGMPPISQSFIMAAAFTGIAPEAVMNPWGYVTMLVTLAVALANGIWLVRGRRMPAGLATLPPAMTTLHRGAPSLLPLGVLLVMVTLLSGGWLSFAALPGYAALSTTPVLKGIAFSVVLAIIVATLFTLPYRQVRGDLPAVCTNALKKVAKTVQIQLCAGAMIGLFHHAGLLGLIRDFATQLDVATMKLGGGLAVVLVGMVTGSQTTAQTAIVGVMAPTMVDLGLDPVAVAIGAAHLAMAGQAMPPVGLTTFVVAGLIGGILNVRVDPLRAMLLSVPLSLCFLAFGALYWYMA